MGQGEWRQGQWSQVRQGFSVAPHVSQPPFTSLTGGPSQAPWEHITHLSAPCHFLKVSPTSLWFIFCSDVCLPIQLPPPKKHKTGVNWGVERPNRASCPSMI